MTVTLQSFRDAFPAFADAVKFPSAQVNMYLGLAVKFHNADRWGDVIDYGAQLWTAHHLTLDYESGRQVAAGQNPGSIRGNVTSMSAAGVSWQRDASSAVDPGAGHWNLSQYGIRWKNLSGLMGAGAMQIGVPSQTELSLSDWPWPGVT